MNTVILFRPSIETDDELKIASKYFPIFTYRSEVPLNSLVIGRYSVLPFYKELVLDLETNSSRLVNKHYAHRWIANFDYYEEVKDYTFKTWFDMAEIPDKPLVVKGRTNSRKARWKDQMFAKNRHQAILIATELMQDPLLQGQGIIFREYEELELLETGLNEQPFVNEHRVFYYGPTRLAHGFYWSQSETQKEIDPEGLELADEIAKNIVSKYANFFVLDVAKTKDGVWKLVEINDGQMSGLSCIDPHELYSNLLKAVGH